LGFTPGATQELEQGVDKIALFVNPAGKPAHAARQLLSGRWKSKLGQGEDIEHDLHDLSGPIYGIIAHVLKRTRYVPGV
jgi:hypothetical protein